MKLYLLPISTRRTLLYAQRSMGVTSPALELSYMDKGTAWAAKTWAKWEKQESGWQRKVVDYGNYAFRRIPYEEWGLKSVPPLSKRRQNEEITGHEKVELSFPSVAIPIHKAEGILKTLATERQALHRKKMMWCFIGMPISAPFALIPIIPNLPFFYLVYRAWSHWRAIAGGKHVQWLIENKLVQPSPSKVLDQLYLQHAPPVEEPEKKEQMLLTQKEVQTFSDTLDIPALEIELERAIWQVEQKLELEETTAKDTTSEARPTDEVKGTSKVLDEDKKEQ